MDLSLGFPEFSQQLALAGKETLEMVISGFETLHRQRDSPVRAIPHQPAPDGEFSPIPETIAARLRDALDARGVTRLYIHQAEAFDHIEAGRNVVIVTPTASGKTLCYNLPVLNLLVRDPGAGA